jgi:MFS transporter, PAT family, beta-lactamase induction signal transducer AmpG
MTPPADTPVNSIADSTATKASESAANRFLAALTVYREPAAVRMLFLGFSAGLPLLLVFGTLSFWLREAGVDRAKIGFISWVALAYAFKWVWSPLVDRLPIPILTAKLGRRRSWLLLSQLCIIAGLVSMAFADPKVSLTPLVVCALIVAFSSATQDIALDAYRIESAAVELQAALAGAYQTGYRIAMIWAGAGALWVAAWVAKDAKAYEFGAWTAAYLVMAASMAVGVVSVFLAPEPAPQAAQQTAAEDFAAAQSLAAKYAVPLPLARLAVWLEGAVIFPFADFLHRYGKQAIVILGLIAIYRISDIVMGVMANAFYVDMGYTKAEVANVTKVYGVVMTIAGGLIGGSLAVRFGVMRVLMLGAVLSAATNLLFSWLATRGHDVWGLTAVVSADNLAQGIAGAAFIAYLSSLTNISYTATQYALFSSLMLLLPKALAGYSGVFVNAHGYVTFFNATALIGVPVLVLVWLAAKQAKQAKQAV